MAKQLAAVLDSLDDLGEDLHDYYVQAQDGKFVLNLGGRPRGFVPQGEHEEFRSNNTTLQNEVTTLKEQLGKFDGVNVDEYTELKGAKDELDRKQLIKSGDVEGLVATEVEKAVKPLSGEIESLRNTNSDLQSQLANKVVDEEIIKAGNAFGKMKAGTEDVLVTKAKAAGFQNVSGELRRKTGEAVVYSTENPGQPQTIAEWITGEAAKEFPWVWEPSTGGGGGGADGEETQVTDGQTKTIAFSDRKSFRENLDDVATGKVKVAPPGS
jgi:hypothetical protein